MNFSKVKVGVSFAIEKQILASVPPISIPIKGYISKFLLVSQDNYFYSTIKVSILEVSWSCIKSILYLLGSTIQF